MAANILNDKEYQKSSAETLARLLERGMVATKDKNFVSSLLSQYKKKGTLSVKQWPWVEKMMARAMGVDKPVITTNQPDGNPTHVLKVGKLYEMFWGVAKKLKKPSFNLMFEQQINGEMKDMEIIMYLYDQKVMVSMVHGNPGWLCSIAGDGGVSFSKYISDVMKAYLMDRLREICANPQKVLAEQGKLLNKCMFCNKTLSDPYSVEHGYGPICAENWGLPFGK